MKTTTYYDLNIVEGSDIVNPLIVDNPNYAKIDEAMHDNAVAGVTLATEIANATVHAITRENSDCAVIRFIATSRWKAGDTATVDGVPVTALLPSGETLPDGAYVINANVLCILTGTNLTVYVKGKNIENASDVIYNDTNVAAELDELNTSVGQINGNIEQINNNLNELANRNFVYSTSEKIVGTWIDNETIYARTFSIVNPSNNQIIESDITKKLIKIEAFAVGTNGYTFTIPYTSSETNIYSTPNGLMFRSNETWNGFTLYVTYYYTKN